MIWVIPEQNHQAMPRAMHYPAPEAFPANLNHYIKLAQSLYQGSQNEEGIALLCRAVSIFPLEPMPYLMLANFYSRVGKRDAAREMLQRAPAIPSAHVKMRIFHLELLMLLEKNIEHIALDTLKIDPINELAITKLGQIYRKTNRLDCMVSLCQAALEQKPEHTTARYQLAVAYTLLGLANEAKQVINLEQFISQTNIAPTVDYTTAEVFEDALVDEIMRVPTLKPDPIYKATINGLQTDILFPEGAENPLKILMKQLRAAVERVITQTAVGWQPNRMQLNAWAVVYPENGRQRAHFHPGAWLSGVYYVSVPKNNSDDPQRGNLVLGVLELDDHSIDSPWGIKHIKPTAGAMVLFPSYFPHATIPTQSNEARICVAFNVVPVY
ncbi:TIGR02466 family protein [bacterium]|nr:TIGR02466 family protein [bacterium]